MPAKVSATTYATVCIILILVIGITVGILGFTYYQRRRIRLAEEERLRHEEEVVASFQNPLGKMRAEAQRAAASFAQRRHDGVSHRIDIGEFSSPVDIGHALPYLDPDTPEAPDLCPSPPRAAEDECSSPCNNLSSPAGNPYELDLADLPRGYMFVSNPPLPDVDLPEPPKPKSNAAPPAVFGFPLLASEFDARHAAAVDPLFPAPPTDVTEILSMRGNRMTIPSYGAAASAGSCVMPRPCDTNDE